MVGRITRVEGGVESREGHEEGGGGLGVRDLNPLMLTAAKNSLTILMQSCSQKQN